MQTTGSDNGYAPPTQPDSTQDHPYAFRDLQQARRPLREHMFAEKSGPEDLCRLTATIGAFTYSLTDSLEICDSRISTALYYLSDQREGATLALKAWNKRAWLHSGLVTDNDLDALAKYPGARGHAPPAVARED